MRDQPSATELLEAVARFLRENATPQLDQHTAFHARVAANAIDIVRRELELSQISEKEERKRLISILGHEGSLPDLNLELSRRLASGELDLSTLGLNEHLWKTTLDKLAVDQPHYASFVREKD